MEDITTTTKIGRNWYKTPIDNKTSRKPISREIPNRTQEIAPLKCHKCVSTSNLDNNCTKKNNNKIELEKTEDTKENNEGTVQEIDSEPSEEKELSHELSLENKNVSFEVTEVHTHFLKYSYECIYLIHVRYSKMQKPKPSRGKNYTAGSSLITNIVINNKEAKIQLY
ncbi:hypothetical protein O181_115108 [Austropuccinia psidii MF-1]|uniref:Uncharacterized protein n=1 Tax=Austropuccinia psidii MF-1 TaxID=1389203 RepID=A0A9Q3K5S4_9BASI|nr:hypothetical protein [Austropuccinia psidii MF-1]